MELNVRLTAREADVLRLLARGRTYAKAAEELDYVPMPANVVKDVEKSWTDDIKDASGKPVFAMTN